MTNATHTVFVYGSLLRGLGNHGLIARHAARGGAVFMGEAETRDPYAMISFGAFPGVVDGGENPERVTGEVWIVDDLALAELDRLEGNGRFYTRKRIVVGDALIAWCYLLPSDYLDHPRVMGGSWRAFVTGESMVDESAVAYDNGADEEDDGSIVYIEDDDVSEDRMMTTDEWARFEDLISGSDDDDDDNDESDPFFVRGEG